MVLKSEIMHNCRVKRYKDGTSVWLVADRDVLRESGFEDAFMQMHEKHSEPQQHVNAAASLARSKRRAKAAVYDLAMDNDFKYFVTFTLDQSKIDRYDIAAITKKLNQWLDNRVRKNGLYYVLVPEFHADGAVHFHGFINDALPVVDSGHVDAKGHKVYNLPAWNYGFTTAIEIYGDRAASVGYMTKYISKSSQKVGGRWYYSGGHLTRPSVEWFDVDFNDFLSMSGAYQFTVDALGCNMLQFTVGGGENE